MRSKKRKKERKRLPYKIRCKNTKVNYRVNVTSLKK